MKNIIKPTKKISKNISFTFLNKKILSKQKSIIINKTNF